MGIYRANAGSDARLDWGTEFALGLDQFDETRALAATVTASNEELARALAARTATRRPLLESRVRLRLANQRFDREARAFVRYAEAEDGKQGGTLSKEVAPRGVTAIIAPRGRAQIAIADAWLKSITSSKHAGVAALREEKLAPLQATFDALVVAGRAYEEARKAYLDAFAVELAERADHRRQIRNVMSLAQAALDHDRDRLAVLTPEADESSSERPSVPEDPETPA